MMMKPPKLPAPDAYWISFDQFIAYYAGAEWQINRLVRHYYKLNSQISNIILGEPRYDTAMEHIQRLRHTGYIPESDITEIDFLKDQLGKMIRLRNDLTNPPFHNRRYPEWKYSNNGGSGIHTIKNSRSYRFKRHS
jgi:hypothetical protein